MTAAFASDQRLENGAEQLESLRRQMALLSEKVSGGPAVRATWCRRDRCRCPGDGGSAVGCAVTAAEHGGIGDGGRGNAAIVGQPDIGLLAAVEMGADLSRLAVIPDPGTDPVEVAAVLIDGMDLVVLGLGGRRVTRARARAVVARARQKAAPCWSPTATGKACRRGLRPGSAAMRSPRPSGACPPGVGADQWGAAADQRAWTVMASARVLAIWCMDWPAVAAAAAAGLSATAPVAVTLANRVIACSATARAAGVRRGLRRREAAARCPQLFIATADADRDARLFEGVIAAVDDLVPRAELLRPGLLVLPVRGPARFSGPSRWRPSG